MAAERENMKPAVLPVRDVEATRAKSSQLVFNLLLNILDLTISSCKSVRIGAEMGCNLEPLHRHIRAAKRCYGQVLIHSSRHRMTLQDVQLLEWRSRQIEHEISAMERRIRGDLHHRSGLIAGETLSQEGNLSFEPRKSVVY